jgi:hypothetical protein
MNITPTRIIPNPSPDVIITQDDNGYHVTKLGAEVPDVDPVTGDVCRKRPATSRVTVPLIDAQSLAAILVSRLSDLATAVPGKHLGLAIRLQERANVHIFKPA